MLSPKASNGSFSTETVSNFSGITSSVAIGGSGIPYKVLLPLPVPASIYGMVILFVCLLSGIIKLDSVRETGKFLIEIMPVMFIPAGVGLITSWNVLKPLLIPVSIITCLTIVTVMIVSGHVAQIIIKKGKNKEQM